LSLYVVLNTLEQVTYITVILYTA